MKKWLKEVVVLSIVILVIIILYLFWPKIETCTSCDLNNSECLVDSDCSKAGCSGQICTTKLNASNIITSCEYMEEYTCYQESTCGCVNNKCNWKEEDKLNKCLSLY